MQYRITAKYDPDFYRPIEAKLAIIEGLNGRLQYVSVNPRERIIKIITAIENINELDFFVLFTLIIQFRYNTLIITK